MATLRDIKRRIVGITNTQQITKAMKMVAAARLRRAQENIINARPYSKKIEEVLGHLIKLESSLDNPLFKEREVKKIAAIVVTSDRGLCGGFNMNVIRLAEETIQNEYSEYFSDNRIELYCIGKKGNDYFSKRDYKIAGSHLNIFSDLKFDFVTSFISGIKEKFLTGEYDKVIVFYNEFKSVVQQKLNVKQILPIKPIKDERDSQDKDASADYIYEPDKLNIINSLLPKHLNSQMWKILLDSYAAELGARMTAMDMATENAKDLIRSLQLTYNKERQASITKEILEIVSGANALKES